jgi:hypothetical protein
MRSVMRLDRITLLAHIACKSLLLRPAKKSDK